MKTVVLILSMTVALAGTSPTLEAQSKPGAAIPKIVTDIKLGIPWKQFVLDHPEVMVFKGFDIDGDNKPIKPDPQKPQPALEQELANPFGLITYFFTDGILQGVTFARTEADQQGFLMEARQLFWDSPQMGDDPRNPGEKIYSWKDSSRLIQVMIPMDKIRRGIAIRIVSFEYAQKIGLGSYLSAP